MAEVSHVDHQLEKGAAVFAVVLREAAADERKWRSELAEITYRRPRHATPTPAGRCSSAKMSRRSVLLGGSAAVAIAAPALSRETARNFLSIGPVQVLRSMQR